MMVMVMVMIMIIVFKNPLNLPVFHSLAEHYPTARLGALGLMNLLWAGAQARRDLQSPFLTVLVNSDQGHLQLSPIPSPNHPMAVSGVDDIPQDDDFCFLP